MLSAVASVLAVAAYLPVTPLRSVIAARAPSPLLQEQETVTSPSFNPFGQAKVPKGQQPLRELKCVREATPNRREAARPHPAYPSTIPTSCIVLADRGRLVMPDFCAQGPAPPAVLRLGRGRPVF